jgi:anti-anti-sigma factor
MTADAPRCIYRIEKRIVISNADSLREMIEKQIEACGNYQVLVFDLQSVTECDSYGLKMLIDFHRRENADKKQLILYRPSDNLRELFKITRLDDVFVIQDVI